MASRGLGKVGGAKWARGTWAGLGLRVAALGALVSLGALGGDAWAGPPDAGAPAAADAAAPAAKPQPSAGLLILQGTNETPAVIDRGLANVSQLRRPPLASYNTYRLLDQKTLPLTWKQPVSYGLANGGSVRMTLLDIVEPQRRGEKARAKVRVEITTAGAARPAKVEVTVGDGEKVFVGGQAYGRGVLVLGVSVDVPQGFKRPV